MTMTFQRKKRQPAQLRVFQFVQTAITKMMVNRKAAMTASVKETSKITKNILCITKIKAEMFINSGRRKICKR